MACLERRLTLVSFVVVAAAAGCSSDAPSNPTAAATQKAAPATSRATPASEIKREPLPTPEAAVQTVVDGLKASKPIVVWDILPTEAQDDIDKVISTSIAKVDREVWDRTVATLKKLVTLLETKKEFILASRLWKTGQLPKLDDVKASWDPGVKLLRAIVDSEVVDREKMSAFNGAKFLEGTGAKLFADARAFTKTMKSDPLAIIDTAKFTVKKTTDSSANLTITLADPKAKPIHLALTVVGRKWTCLPLNMSPTIVGLVAMKYLDAFRPYRLVEWKATYLKDMDRLGKILDRLQGAKTSDDFQPILSAQFIPFVALLIAELNVKRPPETAIQKLSWERQANTALVVVKGLHTFDESTYHDLTKSLRAVNPDTFRGPLEADGSTLFFLGPAEGILDKTVDAIKVGKIVDKDKLRDTVTVELATSLKEEKSTAEAGAKVN